MKPTSKKVRELIVSAKQEGNSTATIVRMLKVSERTVYAIWELYRRTGNVEPKVYTGRVSRITDAMQEAMRDKIKREPDSTLAEPITDLNLPITKSPLSKWLIKQGYSF